MEISDLTSTDRAEIAKLYIAHLGEPTISKEEAMESSPTRRFIKSLLEEERPNYEVLSDEEILTCLQVTLHQGAGEWGPIPELVLAARELLRTSILIADIAETDAHWVAFWLARDQVLGALVKAEKADKPDSTLPPYYTAEPAFLDWLADEKRGWLVLREFLEYFDPDWFREYVKTREADARATEDMHADAERVRMAGVAAACNEGRKGP